MSDVIAKSKYVKTWSESGVGWVQLNHENKLNPLSAGFILAIKEAAEKGSCRIRRPAKAAEAGLFYFLRRPANGGPSGSCHTRELPC